MHVKPNADGTIHVSVDLQSAGAAIDEVRVLLIKEGDKNESNTQPKEVSRARGGQGFRGVAEFTDKDPNPSYTVSVQIEYISEWKLFGDRGGGRVEDGSIIIS